MINKLDKYDPYDLMWATVKYDDLMQRVFQNLILIQLGKWAKPLCECTEQETRLYDMRRAWLLERGIIKEDDLRRIALSLYERE